MLVFELYCTIAILFLGSFAIIHSFYLPVMGPRALSPALFPMVIGILLVALSIIQIVIILKKRIKQKNKISFIQEEVNKEQLPSNKREEERNLILIVIMLLAYMYLLPLIHFIPATLLFLVIIMSYVYKKVSIKIVIISVLITLTVFFTFSELFNLILP